MPVIELDYAPRAHQQQLHDLLDTHRFGVAVAHRRMGKSVCSINHLIKACVTCHKERPRFAYLAPTYSQGKSIAFDYIQHYSRPIPGVTFNQSELRADYPNGGQLRIYGADSPDSLRGIYLDGIVLDEFGLMSPRVYGEVIRPALSDRTGWAFFIGTPNGKNQFYDIVEHAKREPDWFFAEFKASQTHILPAAELEAARRDMTADEYQQEYECSFEASVKGAIYANELAACRAAGRVTRVNVEPLLPVDTTWDLGVGDATAIWFTQSLRSGEVRVIDYYEASGEGLPHYARLLQDKGYLYGQHWAPHDVQVRELGSGRSRLETAASLGIKFQVCPNIPLEDGIHAARMLFPICWFDEAKCRVGLESLQHYRRDWNSRLNEFKDTPVHDFSSHAADAWRYLSVRQKAPKDARRKIDLPAYPHTEQGWLA